VFTENTSTTGNVVGERITAANAAGVRINVMRLPSHRLKVPGVYKSPWPAIDAKSDVSPTFMDQLLHEQQVLCALLLKNQAMRAIESMESSSRQQLTPLWVPNLSENRN